MLQEQVCGNTSALFYNVIKQYIKSHPQEPFDLDFMPECFLEELKTDQEENQVEALDCCLRVLDLDKLLGTLYEFIETYVKYSPSNEKEWKYVKLLSKQYTVALNSYIAQIELSDHSTMAVACS